MANYSNLKTAIENAVDWNNGDNEITGQNLLDILETIIDSLGAKYKFADVATPSSSITTPDEPLFYLAGAGTYTNFSGLSVTIPRGTLAIFYYDTAWHYTTVRTDSDAFFNVNQNQGTPSTTYTKANARNAVPEALRSKGMIITYLTTNGWIIEQNLSTSGTWNADANWQTIGPVSVSQNILSIGGEEKGLLAQVEESNRYVEAHTDKDDRVYEAIDNEGNKILFIPQIFKDKVTFEGVVEGVNGFDIESDDNYIFLFKDKTGTKVGGMRKDGQFVFADGSLSEMWEKIAILIKNAINQYDSNYDVRHVAFGADDSMSYIVVGRKCEGAKNYYCIGIGYGTLANNTGIKNIAVGSNNMENATGHDNTSIGYHASFRNTSGNYNSAVGSESQDDNTTGTGNVSIGFCSLQRNNKGDYNVAIGYFALCGNEAGHYEPENLKNLYNNVAIGSRALVNALTGTNGNIAIGRNTMTSHKKYENCIAIGEGVDCEKDNQTTIGNNNTEETIVRGDFIVKGTDGVKRQIVFNQDGTCSWVEVTE